MQHWEVDGFNTTAVIEKMENGGWKHVCNCNYGYAEPQKHLELNKENAKKISAVPDMIVALENCVTAMLYGDPNEPTTSKAWEFIIKQAQAALKKAK